MRNKNDIRVCSAFGLGLLTQDRSALTSLEIATKNSGCLSRFWLLRLVVEQLCELIMQQAVIDHHSTLIPVIAMLPIELLVPFVRRQQDVHCWHALATIKKSEDRMRNCQAPLFNSSLSWRCRLMAHDTSYVSQKLCAYFLYSLGSRFAQCLGLHCFIMLRMTSLTVPNGLTGAVRDQ